MVRGNKIQKMNPQLSEPGAYQTDKICRFLREREREENKENKLK